ncbi:MAG: hypothetical protein ABF689_08400 [Gluconobacter cerinus]|uniref:hypothetical protein n=1 Tax=Gluconobacter cerinus TaxID=38307 RepID=UPI0039E732A6
MSEDTTADGEDLKYSPADHEEEARATSQVLMRVLAEVIKRMPSTEKGEILGLLDDCLHGTDSAQTGDLAKDEPEFERMMHAQHMVVRDLTSMIKSEDTWLMKRSGPEFSLSKKVPGLNS